MAIQSSNVPQIVTLDEWQGVNLQASRTSIEDQSCWWLENMFPVGPGQLRSAYGPSAPIYTAPAGVTICRIFFADITTQNPSGFMCLSDGSVTRVDLNSHATVNLGYIWAAAPPNYWADIKLWTPNQFGATGGQVGGIVLGSPQGMYAVDGNDLVSPPGTPAPNWLTGGNSMIMPSGLPGIFAMEVYNQRLWVMGQTVVAFSAPTNGVDFSAAGGGGAFPYQGDQLTSSYTDLHATAGFLYVFGDSCAQAINSINLVTQTTPIGVLYTTQFQFQNVDPQIGQRFFRPVGVWEQSFTLWNGSGIYLLTGGQMNWASERLTNLLATLDPAPFMPTQCPAHIFGKKWMLFNGTMTDVDKIKRSMLLCWSGPQLNQWVIASQNLNLTNIGCIEQNSVITPYGTDGTSLYQLFAQPDPNLEKRIQTKLYTGQFYLTQKDWKRTYVEWQDNMGGPEGVFLTGELITKLPQAKEGRLAVSYSLPPGGYDTSPSPEPGKGFSAALDLKGYSPDFTVARISFTLEDRVLFGA